MFKKLMKRLTNNMGLKILSVLISVILWLVVVNIADPDATQTFSVPVTILNKEVIEQMGKVPDVINETDIAVFTISGPRSYVEEMDADDFTVTADLSQVDLTEDKEVMLVSIDVTPKKNEKYITVHQKTVNMQVTLEELEEKNFVISPITSGEPADGCAIGEVEVKPNLLTISGPESVVSKISKVTATINVNGISSDVTDDVVPVLYDEEGEIISSDLLEVNRSTVTITAKILGTKNLTIQCSVTGEPAEGYEYRGLEYAPQSVKVKGEVGLLNTMSVINIPGDVIDITGATADVENTIYIEQYLQDGISLVDEEGNQIAIKALIEQKASKVFNLPTANITVDGLADNYELSFNNTAVSVTVRASRDDMDSFNISSIQASMDVSDLEPGIHTVPLVLVMNDEKYEVVGTVSVQITIIDPEAEDSTGGISDGSSGTTGGGTSSGGNTGGAQEGAQED